MKTYLLSIPQRLKQQNAVLDVKALLCNNAWDTINNEGQKQVLIFHNDGSMIVSTNGNVSMCEWKIEPLAGTIVISSKEHAEMFKAGMVQEILVLAKDGSNEVLSLIDSKNTKIIPNRTVNELTAYLNYQDRLIEENIQHDRMVAEQQNALEEEKKRQEELNRIQYERQRQNAISLVINICRENKSRICSEYYEKKDAKKDALWTMFWGVVFIAFSVYSCFYNEDFDVWSSFKSTAMELIQPSFSFKYLGWIIVFLLDLMLLLILPAAVFAECHGFYEILTYKEPSLSALIRAKNAATIHLSDHMCPLKVVDGLYKFNN